MNWILGNIRLISVVALVFSLVGWQLHTVWDGYWTTHSLEKSVEKAHKGTNDLIKFHGDLNKVKPNAQKDCYYQPAPADVLKLLK